MTKETRDAAIRDVHADWRQQLREAVRDIRELERLLELPAGTLADGMHADPGFGLLVPRGFVARMRLRDPLDPLLLQILPTSRETTDREGFVPDPLGEQRLARGGSIAKYPGRILLVTTGACPVHCRYCFRREFPYSEHTASRDDWRPALEAIRRSPGVREVILSGGDPLSLGNNRLHRLIRGIESIDRVSTLRIHTRYPIMLPARVDGGLIELLETTRLNTVVVVHANHPSEIDESVAAAAALLRSSVNLLLNQSVLLRGINDTAETLIRLSEQLVEAGIQPYYLHLLDRVSGASHFEVDATAAKKLIVAMRRQAPGYLVPALVRDDIGELSKTRIG